MNTFKSIFVLILTTLLFTSCEDVIQVKLDEGEPILTVDAFINDMRTQQKVRLTYTGGYFSQKANSGISGAVVNLKDLKDGKVYSFKDLSNGNYIYDIGAGDTLAKVDHTYELTITHNGNVFKSTSRMNRTVNLTFELIKGRIDTSKIVYELKEASLGRKEGYELTLLAADSENIKKDTSDFYWIKSFKNGVMFNKGADINVAFDAGFGKEVDGFPFITPIAQGINSFGEVFKKGDVSQVEIHSINEETYNFLLQVQLQTTNSGLFATNPENIRTNITNTSNNKVKVVGWFCMSAVAALETTIK